MIDTFKEIYGEKIYTEKNDQYKGLKVKLKKGGFEGVIESLWLPSNKGKKRNNDLYLINWDNGKSGIIELRELEIELV